MKKGDKMSKIELNVLCNSITLLAFSCLIFKQTRKYFLMLFSISTGIYIGFESIKHIIDWIKISLSLIIFIVFSVYSLHVFDKNYNLKIKSNRNRN